MAGVPTYVIPHFIIKNDIDYEGYALKIHSITKNNFDNVNFIKDLAFNTKDIETFSNNIRDLKEDNLPFIINFASYDTDGNYFKIVSHIKDVSKFYFIEVIETFGKEHKPFLQKVKKFNLDSVYRIIPVDNKSAKRK